MKDIAELAEVSRATVDRFIHGRGKVSKKAYDKIKYVLDTIDYQPNVLARSLQKGDSYRIAALLPDYEFDVFWKSALDGIDEALKRNEFLGLVGDKYLFNPFKTASFKYNSRLILEGNYDAVLLAPFFFKESCEFFEKCNEKGIPYATFNNDIKEASPITHIGQDLFQSGNIAASLFNRITNADDDLLILHIEEDYENSKHLQEKEEGFKQFFSEGGRREKEKISVLKIGNRLEIEKQLMNTLEKNKKITGIFVSTSKVHFVADVKEEYTLPHKLIGYDLVEKNVKYLESSIIDFLIYQNPKSQASQGMALLAESLVFKKEIPKQMLLPIEIIIRENVKNYLGIHNRKR